MIAPIDEVYANESGTLTICRYYSRGSLKDYLHRVNFIPISFVEKERRNFSRRDQRMERIGNVLVQPRQYDDVI